MAYTCSMIWYETYKKKLTGEGKVALTNNMPGAGT
jgi:hypothetical protein